MIAGPGNQPRRALVLGGGGVLGFSWMLGALTALEAATGRDTRDADIIIGTSAGSVAAGLISCGLPLDAICRHHQGAPAPEDMPIAYDYDGATGGVLPPRPGWRPGSPRLVLDLLRHGRISPLVALSGLLPSGRGSLQPVHDLMRSVTIAAGFGDTWPSHPRPWVVTVDYRSGRRIVFGRDELPPAPDGRARVPRSATLAEAVTASCSIPAWYPPTVIDGVPYIDGGTVSNASVDLLRGTGVTEVAVLVPMASIEADHGSTALSRLERRVRRAITRTLLAEAAVLRAEGARVLVVTPGTDDLQVIGLNLMNPRRRRDVFELARHTAAVQLADQLSAPTDPPTRDHTEPERYGTESA